MTNVGFVAVALAGGLLFAQDWRPSYPVTDPGPLTGTRMAFDAARSELVLFGGNLVASPANANTWVWNGTTWTQRSPATSPGARQYHAMCYDAVRQRVVVFGGNGFGLPGNDTWEWNGTTWTNMLPPVSPPARQFPVIVYDGTRTLLFGGGTSAVYLNDTWAWNGTTWTQLSPANSPPPRYWHSMAGGAGEVLLFGGRDPNIGYLNDTWVFTANNWSQASSAAAPSVRGLASMAYDAANARYLLFSGANSFFSPLEDTWAFAAGQWTQIATQRSPSNRRAGGVAWFPPQNRFVVHSAEYLSGLDLKSTPMWEFGQNLASFIRWGPSACQGIDPPVLRAHQSQPVLGTTFEARVESFNFAIGILAIGLSTTSWAGGSLPFDLVAVGTNPNCLLRVSPDVLLALGFGQSQPWVLPIPSTVSLLNYTMHAQGFTWGAGAGLNISTANAATLVVGTN